MMTFLWDIRSNLRLIARSPGYSAIVVATLAFGIGVNTAVFDLVNSVILQPLPYPQPERLVRYGSRREVQRASPLARPRSCSGRIPLVEGRFFDSSDGDLVRTVIINQAMAQRLWPDESPIGRRFKILAAKSEWFEIVGVVGSTRFRGLGLTIAGEIYVPYRQRPSTDLGVVMRSSGDTTLLAGALRREVQELDPDQPVDRIKTMDEIISDSLAEPRFHTALFGFFSILALFLSVLGVYGVLTYSVITRTHEMGVRLALGADAGKLIRLVLIQGMKIVLVGIMVGLAAALSLMRFLSSLLYGITSYDLWTFATVTLLLLVVALLACYIPARRVLRVDPIIALRE